MARLKLIISVAVVAFFSLNLVVRGATPSARERRVLYNFDGDSDLFTRRSGKGPVAVTAQDLRRGIEEVTYDGSLVDTVLVCINAQTMYYPTDVGTMRGGLSTPEERAKWPASETQRFENVQRLFGDGIDPYSVMLAEAKRRGRETLLTFRMNDAHGLDFLRTQFWTDHPDYRLPGGALDFAREEVRDHVYCLIAEAVRRYDCDGIELDFNRFPTFFKDAANDENVSKINSLVKRVRNLLDAEAGKRGRPLVLGARVPSNYGNSPPTYESCLKIGCDPAVWAKNGWIDFLTVSEFLYTRYDLPLKAWKELIREVPIYGGIEYSEGNSKEQCLTAEKYRRAARHLWQEGVDGVYLFNFFVPRHFFVFGGASWEPPFEVLTDLGDPKRL